jgi:hypothetical protein
MINMLIWQQNKIFYWQIKIIIINSSDSELNYLLTYNTNSTYKLDDSPIKI